MMGLGVSWQHGRSNEGNSDRGIETSGSASIAPGYRFRLSYEGNFDRGIETFV